MEHSSLLPPLTGLQAVLAASRSGSFSGAAGELRITHGAVSRRVQATEQWAGVSLFERHGRGVRLTIDGQRFIGLVEQALDLIGSGASQWRAKRTWEVVRVSTVPSFARLWLLPNLAALEGDPPDLRVDCEIDHRFADVAQTDVAIRYGPGGWREWIATPLAKETLVPVASPRLAQALGPAPSAGEMLQHPLIHDTYTDAWRVWLAAHGQSYRPRPQDRRFPDYDLALQAAAAGCGVGLLRQPYGNTFVDNGSLARLSDNAIANPMRFHALTRAGPKRRPVELLIRRLASL